MTPDMINAVFEAMGGIMILNHCRVLYKAKTSKEISLISTMFFLSWGIWNIFYYYSLDQTFSWYCGLSIALANLLWIGLILYYRRNNNDR